MKILSGLATGMLLASTALGSAFAQTATVSIDADNPGDTIEPEIYGHFAEHLGRSIYEGIWVGEDSDIPNTDGFRNDVLSALQELEVPVIRWPGGCFADEYDWRDGIGPREDRPRRINTHWGWVIEDNAFGTHEFLNFSEMIGADPYVAGNMGSGSPREMSRWFEYMTTDMDSTMGLLRAENGREEPWDVPYFGVGNESWGCGGNMLPEYSAQEHNRYATFIDTDWTKGQEVKRVATGANIDDYAFTEALMELGRYNLMDAISLHYYTFTTAWEDKGDAIGFSDEDWASVLKNSLRMSELIDKHTDIMDEYDPDNRVDLYVDEWGTWYNSTEGSPAGFLEQQNSIRDALVGGLTLNIFHRNTDRVKMANIAQMVNVLQASILTDGERMLRTPTYHLLNMYKPFRNATPLPATVDGDDFTIGEFTLPYVDVSVARGEDGKLVMALVNLSPEGAVTVRTGINGTASGSILTAPAMDSHNTFDNPDNVVPADFSSSNSRGRLTFDLPPRSVAVVIIEE
ncbi:alpha-N-arabinofuranosidase [Parvularcula flava]|uniref:non-reducing end alpha-L-arabinofuranosidase n=1 Tax=Aquisalinus luteolus TaxID=1566827 RepID=A0A8J3A3F3_9PROT|nr:alpha-L-arabinofuranosidase C-terminal domain-containing protein [Aquisalinus luteolus]NHK27911.1 alpha-N-arabinofuranosidase [Aquisalinus luteolus]GGH96882.1 alpha-L-arabinofuranosidase [Aquisalinus luteolus]